MSTVEFSGARVELADAVDVVSGAGTVFEPVLHRLGTAVPALPSVAVLVARSSSGGAAVLRFRARIRTPAKGFDGPLHPAIVGAAYVAPIVQALSKLIDPARVTDPAGREGAPPPPADRPAVLDDPDSGLRMTVVHGRPGFDGLVTDIADAEYDIDPADHSDQSGQAGPADLERLTAFLRMTFDLARRRAGHPDDTEFFRGRSYVLSRIPPHSPAGPAGADRLPDDVPEPARLDQLGGLDDVVQQLRDVADSFKHPEVMARWGARRPQGILMWGPPGTGKTTLANALATEIGGTMREVRTPDILSKWVGSSERNIKKIFTEARAYRSPTVLLFDEFDSIISYNGAPQGAADQVANSVAGLFKQEMNGLIDANPNVIVVATTNFPGRVDESLIRSGRFDVKIAVPLPDVAGRTDILSKMIGRLQRRHDHEGFQLFGDDVDAAELAGVTPGMSGADLRELLRRVQMAKAMQEARSGVSEGPIRSADLKREIAAMLHHH